MKKECAVPISLTEDGNAYPLLCPGARVNVGAWLFYEQLRPSVMALTRNATPRDVATRACDLHGKTRKGFNSSLTLPEYVAAYTLAAAYNGWRTSDIGRWEELMSKNVSPARCVTELLKGE